MEAEVRSQAESARARAHSADLAQLLHSIKAAASEEQRNEFVSEYVNALRLLESDAAEAAMKKLNEVLTLARK